MAQDENKGGKNKAKKDLDGDGVVSPEELAIWRQNKQAAEAAKPDVLSKEELAQKYGYALNVIYADEELRRLFERAVNAKDGQWSPEKFQAELQSTDWWKHGQYWRTAWVSENDGVEWQSDMDQAKEIVSRRAAALGARVDDKELNRLARQYLYKGWYEGTRAFYLDNALSVHIGKNAVGEGDIESTLRTAAWEYGVDTAINDRWYTNAMRRVARGEATLESLTAEIRQKSKSTYRTFRDDLDKGQTLRDAASSYISTYADLMEMNDKDVDLKDPLFKQAWGGLDDEGKPKTMTVYEFETAVRTDPRWRETGNGRRTTMSVADSFLKSLGFGGRING